MAEEKSEQICIDLRISSLPVCLSMSCSKKSRSCLLSRLDRPASRCNDLSQSRSASSHLALVCFPQHLNLLHRTKISHNRDNFDLWWQNCCKNQNCWKWWKEVPWQPILISVRSDQHSCEMWRYQPRWNHVGCKEIKLDAMLLWTKRTSSLSNLLPYDLSRFESIDSIIKDVNQLSCPWYHFRYVLESLRPISLQHIEQCYTCAII